MSRSITLETVIVPTLADLADAIAQLKFLASMCDETSDAPGWPEVLLEDSTGKPITFISLIESTLSDGSKVYNARLF